MSATRLPTYRLFRHISRSACYPTQKPPALLDRIIQESSKVNSVDLDPFWGSVTACVAADALDRLWIGVDIAERAAQLVCPRIDDLTRKIVRRTDIPTRSDIGKIPIYSSLDNNIQLYGEQGATALDVGHTSRSRTWR